jgi:plasmid replication initiation protein
MQSVITIETGKNAKGKASWEKFTWFEYAKFDAETGMVTMTFSAKLAAFLSELRKMYAKLYLKT